MASATELLRILITADSKQAVASIENVGKAADKDLKKAAAGSRNLGDTFLKTGAVMVGASAAIAVGLASTIKSAQASDIAQRKLQNTIQNSPKLVGASVEVFNKQAKALQDTTVASDEAVNGIQALLGQFGLTQRQILSLTPLVVDISRKMGLDFNTAAKAVGKAVDGQAGGLRRLGVAVDLNVYKQDKLRAITDALSKAAGGFAKSEGKTFDGQLAILRNHMDDLKESIGRGVVSVLNDLLPAANSAGKALGSVDDATGGMIGKLATVGVATSGAVGGILLIAGAATKMKAAFQEGGALAGSFGTAVKGVGLAGVGVGAVLGITSLIGALKDLAGVSESAADRVAAASRKKTAALTQGFIADAEQAKTFVAQLRQNNHDEAFLSETTTRLREQQFKRFQELAQGNLGTAKRLVDGLREHRAEAEAAGINVDRYSAALKAEAGAQRQAGQDTKTATDILDEHKRAVEDDAKALDNRRGALLASLNDTLGAQRAEQQLGETLRTNQDPLARQQALLDAAGAAAQLAGDNYAAMTGKTADAAQKNQFMVDALNGLKAKFPELTPIIDGYIAKLNSIPPQKTTDVNIRIHQTLDQIFGNLGKTPGFLNFDGTPNRDANQFTGGGRATGGPVYPGTTYVVGERGPELLKMGASSGKVVPLRPAASQPSVTNINISKVERLDEGQLARKIAFAVGA